MKHPMPWGRILLGLFATGSLVIAISLFVISQKINNVIKQARIAEPLLMDVNLSTPGTYTGKVAQTFFWEQVVYIKPAQEFRSQPDAAAMVAGLKGSVDITNSNGLIVRSEKYD
jgi:hypothetical protein